MGVGVGVGVGVGGCVGLKIRMRFPLSTPSYIYI